MTEPSEFVLPRIAAAIFFILKGLALVVLVLIVAVAVMLFVTWYSCLPPKEAKFLANFQAQRASFEQLRDMLQADKQVSRMGPWGVATTDVIPHMPPDGGFPVERYQRYMAVFKQAEVRVAERSDARDPGLYFGIWGCGFGGYTQHVGICWLDKAPTKQIATIDGYHGRTGLEQAFRHIDGNWYLWTDQ